MKYKNYQNSYTNDNRIYSKNEMLDMTVREIKDRAEEFIAQHRVLGLPDEDELRNSSNVIWIDEYTKDDGTKVSGHWRSLPNGGISQSGTPTGGAVSVENSEFVVKNEKDGSNKFAANENIKNNHSSNLYGYINDIIGFNNSYETFMYVLGTFLTNYLNMKNANTINADKYFHAKANYESSQLGYVAYMFAKLISDVREWTDSYRNIHEKGYTREFSENDFNEDQKANNIGRAMGIKNPTTDANEVLKNLIPPKLSKKYR